MKPKTRIPPRSRRAPAKPAAAPAQDLFRQGLALHQRGQLAQAREMYRRVLDTQPDHFDALHLSGVIAAQTKNPQQAVVLIGRALALNPQSAAAHGNRGNALQELRRFEDALAAYDRAIELKADYAEAYSSRGNVLKELGRFEQALASCDRAIALKADHAEAHGNRGGALRALKRLDEALASYDEAIRLKADFAAAYSNRGVVLQELKRYDEALASYDQAIKLKADHAEAYSNRSVALHELKRYDEALASCDQAIRLRADYAEAYSNRGLALLELERFDEALASCDRAIRLKADYAEAYSNRGNVLRKLGRLDEAVASCDRAIRLKGDFAEAWCNRGVALQDLQRFDEAQASYEAAIRIDADCIEAHWNLSLCQLLRGDFARGWAGYEWGWANGKREARKYRLAKEWQGTKMAGSLLVLPEQGIGDQVFYSGMLNDLKAYAEHITVAVDPRLVTLYERSFDGVTVISADSLKSARHFDMQVYMAGMGRFLRGNPSSMNGIQGHYLRACPARAEALRSRLRNGKRLICGLSWVSKNTHFGADKSLRLRDFGRILGLPDFDFVDLQYGDTSSEQAELCAETGITLKHVPEIDNFNDIDGLAALIEACDMVLTVSNTTAHLAASLGKPVFVVLPFSAGLLWYWHVDRDDSPWYPSARLYRQARRGDWPGVLERVRADLSALPADAGRAAAGRPDAAPAQAGFQHGFALHQQGLLAQAREIYRQVLETQTGHFDALHLSGVIAAQTQNPQEALELIDRALALNPGSAAAFNNRANALRALGRLDDALASCDRAIELLPDYAEVYGNRGNVLKQLGRLAEAVASYGRAVELKPDHAEAWRNRGVALKDMNRFGEALASYERAIEVRPDYAEAHGNRGVALHKLGRLDEALASYDRAIALKGEYAEVCSDRGVALHELKRFDEAIASFDRAIRLKPEWPEGHWNLALCRLLTGDFARGWEGYEWRWKREKNASAKRDFTQPLWLGKESLQGSTILLHGEQGLGDTLQFCRYVRQVAALGARVILEAQKPLLSVLSRLDGVQHLVARGAKLPAFDCHCPLLSLPLAFRTDIDTIAASRSYLGVEAGKVAEWRARLGERTGPRVGLVWSGSTKHDKDSYRSIALADIVGYLPPQCRYVSLQKEVRRADAQTLASRPDILHFGEQLKDFADTAAICELMDVVVSVDTSVAHLAGALGKPVWLLLPWVPDWRWLLDREDSPWYPTATLYRQARPGDWPGVLARVGADLAALPR